MPELAALRPMSTSQVLDRTFSLYRHNFLLFAGIAALPPALVLVGELLLVLVSRPFSTGAEAPGRVGGPIVAAVMLVLGGTVIFVLWLVGYAMASGASVYAVSRVHLGYPTGIGESYRIIRPHIGAILGIVTILFVCVLLVMAVGAACVAIPIIIAVRPGSDASLVNGTAIGLGALVFLGALGFIIFLSAKLSLSVPACVLERLSVLDSLKRSWSLATGTVWRLILVSILAGAIGGAVSGILSIPYLVGIALVVTKKDPSLLFPFVVWQYIANFLAKTLAGPIATVAGALIYYDQRVRKEAFDLQLMMEAIAHPAPPPTATAAHPSAG